MKEKLTNKNAGFVELIIIIVIALFLMRYFGITISGAINWFIESLRSVFR